MSTFRIPCDAYVWTAAGPWRAGDIIEDTELVIVAPNGRPVASPIAQIVPAPDRDVIDLLATCGAVHLDTDSVVSSRGVQMFAAAVAAEIAGGGEGRFEVAQVASLPREGVDIDAPTATRHALALLEPAVIRIPGSLNANADIRRLLDDAEVTYEDASDERWTALVFEATGMVPSTGPIGASEAQALQAITLWTTRDGRQVHRVTLGQSRLRQRLIAGLAARGGPAAVTWSPAYGPVEARITTGAGDLFTTATRARHLTMGCVDIEIEGDGSAITDLVIVRARR